MADNTLTKIVEIELKADKAIDQMVAYNEAIAESTKLEVEAQEKFGKLSKELIAQQQKTQALRREKQALQREVQNEIKLQSAQEGSLKQMRAQLTRLTKTYDELSKAERDNVNVGGKMQEQIKALTQEIKGLEGETERYQRNVGNYTNSIMQAVGINGNFASALTNVAKSGGTVKGAMATATAGVKSFGASMAALMANPVFLAIAGIAGAGLAFKWFSDYNDGIAEATRLTREFTGLTGEALSNLRSDIQATAEVMDKDYKDVLQTVDALMVHFHITSAEALDVINKGFAAGADVNGDFLSKLQSSVGVMSDAGIAADELVSIITQTRSGIFSDQGLDLIAKASRSLRIMTDETARNLNAIGIDAGKLRDAIANGDTSVFEAIQLVTRKIGEFKDGSQEAAKVINSVFGKQGLMASQQMVEELGKMTTNLDDVVAVTGDYGVLLQDQIKSQGDLEKAAAALFEVENGGWEAVKMKTETYFNIAATKVLTFWQNGKKFWMTFFDYIKGGAQSLADIFSFAGSQAVKIGSAFSSLGEMIAGAFTFDTGKISSGWERLKGVINSVGTDYANLKSAIAGNFAFGGGATGDFTPPAVATGGGGGTGTGNENGGGGKTGTGKTAKTKTAKTSTATSAKTADKEAEARMRLAERLMAAAQQMEERMLQKASSLGIEQINAYYDKKVELLKSQYSGLGTMTDKEEEAFLGLLNELDAERNDAINKHIASLEQKARDDARALLEVQLQNVQEGSDEEYLLRKAALDLEFEEMKERYQGNYDALLMWQEKYNHDSDDLDKKKTANEKAEQKARLLSAASTMGMLGELLGQYSDQSQEAAVASKVLAIAEIAINQGVAIAEGVKQAQKAGGFPANIIAIATTVSTILATIAMATKAVNSAKFATGGYVEGAGTGTSDSIPARLSNGESVINAQSTSMFGGLLSALNQIGGGIPIQATASNDTIQGEQMLARAFAMGAAALPAPVVGIKEFNEVSDRVVAIKQAAKL